MAHPGLFAVNVLMNGLEPQLHPLNMSLPRQQPIPILVHNPIGVVPTGAPIPPPDPFKPCTHPFPYKCPYKDDNIALRFQIEEIRQQAMERERAFEEYINNLTTQRCIQRRKINREVYYLSNALEDTREEWTRNLLDSREENRQLNTANLQLQETIRQQNFQLEALRNRQVHEVVYENYMLRVGITQLTQQYEIAVGGYGRLGTLPVVGNGNGAIPVIANVAVPVGSNDIPENRNKMDEVVQTSMAELRSVLEEKVAECGKLQEELNGKKATILEIVDHFHNKLAQMGVNLYGENDIKLEEAGVERNLGEKGNVIVERIQGEEEVEPLGAGVEQPLQDEPEEVEAVRDTLRRVGALVRCLKKANFERANIHMVPRNQVPKKLGGRPVASVTPSRGPPPVEADDDDDDDGNTEEAGSVDLEAFENAQVNQVHMQLMDANGGVGMEIPLQVNNEVVVGMHEYLLEHPEEAGDNGNDDEEMNE